MLSHGDPPGPGRHVFIAAIDRESGRCGPYLVHRPDRRIRRLVELMGESLEPAECPCRRGGNPLPPAPGGPLARWSRNSGYPLFQGDWRRPRGIVTAKVTSPGALGAPYGLKRAGVRQIASFRSIMRPRLLEFFDPRAAGTTPVFSPTIRPSTPCLTPPPARAQFKNLGIVPLGIGHAQTSIAHAVCSGSWLRNS